MLSTLLPFEYPESFLLLCQTNKSLYSTNHNITTTKKSKMNNLEVEIFCDATFKNNRLQPKYSIRMNCSIGSKKCCIKNWMKFV